MDATHSIITVQIKIWMNSSMNKIDQFSSVTTIFYLVSFLMEERGFD